MRSGPGDWRDRDSRPDPFERRQPAFPTPTPPTVPVPTERDIAEELDLRVEHILRPFIVTGGRTRPTDERLRVETVISATPAALAAPLSFERRHIVEICQRPLSVAEVANSLGIPVGVARVLIADLVAERHVVVHVHLGSTENPPSLALLERIREGIRAL